MKAKIADKTAQLADQHQQLLAELLVSL